MHKKIWASLDCFLEQGPVMGRKVANREFIKALFQADPFDEYHFFPASYNHFQNLLTWAAENFPRIKPRLHSCSRLDLPKMLAVIDYYCFHLSDCINYPADMARLRNKYAGQIFPVTSVTHSLSYKDYWSGFLRHLWSGTTSRDCVVCTSRSGMEAVRAYYESARDFFALDEYFNAPQLSHIPLGLDWGKYAAVDTGLRAQGRERQGIGRDDICIIVLGRISYYSKMDFLPFIRSLQSCLFEPGVEAHRIHLFLAGGMEKKDEIGGSLKNLAANAGINLRIISNPSEEEKVEILALADIFVSLADNYQETFGITLLEAAASGLPVIASDFNGYRDLVEHGKSGFLVSSSAPAESGFLNDLAPILPDSQVHLLLAQNVCLDMQEMTACLKRLIKDEELRLEMGRHGREKSKKYDWSVVIGQYIRLWDELWQAESQQEKNRERDDRPLGIDYSRVFSAYPSHALTGEEKLVWSELGESVYRQKDFPVVYAGMEELVPAENLRLLLFLARNPTRMDSLCSRLQAAACVSAEKAQYFVVWALKQGYVRVEE
jgi:glycosyltransferase involved in cell wall biosynthesis